LKYCDGNHRPYQSDDPGHPVVYAALLDRIEPDHVICPELTLRPTPGHTPGHVSIVIESKGERAIVTGDMMHNPIQLERPGDLTRFDMDKELAARTRKTFVDDFANSDVFVIGSHFAEPTGGWIVRDDAGCRLEL